MLARLTTPFRARMADAITGAVSAALTPQNAVLGNAAAGRAPRDTLYDPNPRAATLTVTRNAQHEVTVTAIIPAGQDAVTFDEIGIRAGDGTVLLHATLPQQTYAQGVEGRFEFTLNPEAYDA
ncbi:hypothetical protein [Deinococcus sp. UR1]|uniref:hypothetical protein n=1 Tax=Deinococcus sp. UR1 TaxID=1704277 RepID=UPI000C190B6C|nr:hypothetical protein [Deinococcus sp. UR1]PIG96877.1 hypothetical protein AMD26_015220 [Deinococcus sp. UR1]